MKPFPASRTALALITAALTGWTGCSKHESPGSPPAPAENLPTIQVQVFTAGSSSQEAFEEIPGTVRPKLSATVEAKVSGRIAHLPVVAGQSVHRGELLVELDARETQAQLDRTRALLEQADADLARFQSLLTQAAVTRSEFDAAQARQRVAQAAVLEAEVMLDYSRVTAPFDGVVTLKAADVGDLATPGKPLIRIEDPSQLQLEAYVPETLQQTLQLGDTLEVRILDRTLSGSVAEIAPVSDPGSRTFMTKIDLPPDPELRSGQFGRAYIRVGEFASLRVPQAAVLQRGQLEIVFVAQQGKARLRLIKTGRPFEDEIGIVSGLEAGEKVIVGNLAALIDGQPITVAE